MAQSDPDIQECIVCRLVKDIQVPAYRRVSEDDEEAVWFCLNCDMAGLECSREVAETIKALFGEDFGWDAFVAEWVKELDPMED